jgi:hypothetical protein
MRVEFSSGPTLTLTRRYDRSLRDHIIETLGYDSMCIMENELLLIRSHWYKTKMVSLYEVNLAMLQWLARCFTSLDKQLIICSL